MNRHGDLTSHFIISILEAHIMFSSWQTGLGSLLSQTEIPNAANPLRGGGRGFAGGAGHISCTMQEGSFFCFHS